MERLRVALGEIRTELAPQLRITLSISLAGYSPFQLGATQWLKDADQALHQAKSSGRNRVVLASEAPGQVQVESNEPPLPTADS